MHYLSSKSSKTSHLNHKNSDKRAKFSDEWSPWGGAPSPQPPIGFGPAWWPLICACFHEFLREIKQIMSKAVLPFEDSFTRCWKFENDEKCAGWPPVHTKTAHFCRQISKAVDFENGALNRQIWIGHRVNIQK